MHFSRALILDKSSLPIDGIKGVFTTSTIRKGEIALASDSQAVRGHDLLSGCGEADYNGRRASTLSRWDPIFDLDLTQPLSSSPQTSEWYLESRYRKLAKTVQNMPMRRPLVLFSQERFLALRHTWTSDRHYTMFLPHLPTIDLVVPASSLTLANASNAIETSSQASSGPKNDAGDRLKKGSSAALDLSQYVDSSKITATSSLGDLFFEVNDPFPCTLPDPDDVANPAYWRHIKKWLTDYSYTAAASQHASKGASLFSPNVQLVKLTQSHADLYDGQDDDDMVPSIGRPVRSEYALVALRDIPANTELFLSYGADWWRQRLLSTLLLSAETPSELGSVRWIERHCAAEGQTDDTFPYLVTDRVLVRKGGNRAIQREVLWDALRQERAPTQAVIAYCVRQSCVDGDFAGRMMNLFAGDRALTIMPAVRRMVRAYLSEKSI